ncbi:L,D-transpeptidase [bacterium]|nr:L,D-transpeptidase [bacterium]
MILRIKRYPISSITFFSISVISFIMLLFGSTSFSAEWTLQYYNPTSHLYSHCLPYSIKSWGLENYLINSPAGLDLKKHKALSYVKLFSYEDKLGCITDYCGTWTSQFANSSFGFGILSFPNLKRDLTVTSLGQIYLYNKFTRTLKIVIEKSQYTLSLLDDNDNVIVQYKIGIGKTPGDKQSDGDMRTPEGEFYISKIQNSETWTYDFEDDDLGPIVGSYGPWFLRLETGKWDGIGIHGTHLPKSIGTRCTHGCIRMKNKDLNDLKKRVHIGTPVVIKK